MPEAHSGTLQGMAPPTTSTVCWIERKPRSLGNFSIEASYRSMHDAWPEGHTRPDRHVASRFTKGIWNRFRIWREVGRLPHRILHITGDIHFAAIGRRRPVVLTIHDLGMLDEGPGWKRRLKSWFWLTWPLQSCDRIIAVSDTTKADILRRTDFPADRIDVIPSVISPSYHLRTAPPNHAVPRLLHIGLADNKNLAGHAAALQGLSVHLRIIGEPSPTQLDLLRQHDIDFSWAARLSEAELQQEYAEADALLFCSTLEGYGMPIIEAQTIGVPVITSDRSPMRETAGGGALLANPDDPSDIRRAVVELLDNATQRESHVQLGLANAQRCSASASAEAHAKLYERLLAAR